jgi:hypothetical protein
MIMKQQLNIFLLIGQSNMAGRGRLHESPALAHPRVFMFRDMAWCAAQEPLHTDIPSIAGAGLGMSFATELLKSMPSAQVGLVPCAVGGTPLSRWMPGQDLYNCAVSTALRALADGTLAGILWHQGEGDSGNPDDAHTYGQRFQKMIQRLRSDLGSHHAPFVAGELGEFLRDFPGLPYYEMVNQELRGLQGILPAYACVSSKGLSDNGDHLHFNASSLREFGIRYAAKFLHLKNMNATNEQGIGKS